MSGRPCHSHARMKKGSSPSNKNNPDQFEFNFNVVKLEPELQIEAATFTPCQRLALAVKFERWAHELRVSARVLEKQRVPWRRRSLPRISLRDRLWN